MQTGPSKIEHYQVLWPWVWPLQEHAQIVTKDWHDAELDDFEQDQGGKDHWDF